MCQSYERELKRKDTGGSVRNECREESALSHVMIERELRRLEFWSCWRHAVVVSRARVSLSRNDDDDVVAVHFRN